jgi:zinc finger protein
LHELSRQRRFEFSTVPSQAYQFQGVTRIAIIHIPFFKQVLLESFSCDHCGFKNTSVKSAGEIQEKGTKYTFRIENEDDFQRQIVRGESSVFRIEDIDLEAPRGPGQLTNLESIFSKILIDLESGQPGRKKENPALHDALDAIVQKLINMLNGRAFPITVSLDDPSGNSFIEPSPDDQNSKYARTDFPRTHEQNVALGMAIDEDEDKDVDNEANGEAEEDANTMDGVDIVDGQIYEIPAECPACAKACTVNMKKVQVPHFKEVIIMATVCEHCGYRTNDVKTGGEIPEKGQRITLRVERVEDLSRDILKSETCALKSPELGLEVHPGSLGGRFTTVEGLLTQVRDQLYGQMFDIDEEGVEGLAGGDSMAATTKEKWNSFFGKLNSAIRCEMRFSIILEDPLASSYVGSCGKDIEEDPQITKQDYERTAEEKEDLGLNDMKTENYEADDGTET